MCNKKELENLYQKNIKIILEKLNFLIILFTDGNLKFHKNI